MSLPILTTQELNKKLSEAYSLHSTSRRINGIDLDCILSAVSSKNAQLDFKGRSIAVVGSSERLLDEKYGQSIDDCDNVIRCNLAPVDGYEEYVGLKTTLRLVSCKHFAYRNNAEAKWPNAIQKWLSAREEDLLIRYSGNKRLLLSSVSELEANHRTLYLNPKYAEEIALKLEAEQASIGFTALKIALDSGLKVKAFGFDLFLDGKKHYFQARGSYHSPRAEEVHKLENEKSVMSGWMRDKSITFYASKL